MAITKKAAADKAEADKAAADKAEADKAEADKAAADKAAADKAAADKAAAVEEKPPFYVEQGKSLTTKRGILADGDAITAADLAGGEAALKAFVKSGHVGEA